MYKDNQVTVVIPVGRRMHMVTLFNYLERFRHIIDKIELWQCTTDTKDIEFLNVFCKKHGGWCEIVEPPDDGWKVHISNMASLYSRCTLSQTIYIKMDDDICFIDDGCIEELCKTLLDNPNDLVSANVVNASHTHSLFIERKLIPEGVFGDTSYHENGELADFLHSSFLKAVKGGKAGLYKQEGAYTDFYYVSINMIGWTGQTMQKMVPFGNHDESHFNYAGKQKANTRWILCENALAAHYSYRPSFKKLILKKHLKQYHDVSI